MTSTENEMSETTMKLRTEYPVGVPCWLDLMQADVDAAMDFYGRLFGWTFEVRTPEGSPYRYAYARRDGAIVGGLGGPAAPGEPEGWTTYVRVADADAAAQAVVAAGGRLISEPRDINTAGRGALCADPHGAAIGLWQPAANPGAELVNVDGSWNFSELHTPDTDRSIAFYRDVFGWVCDRFDMGTEGDLWLFRLPGYGSFLAQSDPNMVAFVEEDTTGFADAVAWLEPTGPSDVSESDGDAWWTVTFGVADADAAVARALELGATQVSPLVDTAYTRQSTVRDPQGSLLTLSEYRPPAEG